MADVLLPRIGAVHAALTLTVKKAECYRSLQTLSLRKNVLYLDVNQVKVIPSIEIFMDL